MQLLQCERLPLPVPAGKELGRVEVPSRFTHDAVRRRDKVYVCSTGTGAILQLAFPSMELVRRGYSRGRWAGQHLVGT